MTMRIGNNYQGLIRLFSGMTGINKSKTNLKSFFGVGKLSNQHSGYGRNTLQDLLLGHYV